MWRRTRDTGVKANTEEEETVNRTLRVAGVWEAAREHSPRAYAPLFQGLRTTFSCVFEGLSRELSSHYIINTNYNILYSPIHYRKVANM